MKKPIGVGLKTGKELRPIIAVIVLVLAGRPGNASAQTETNLYSLGNPADGAYPQDALLQGSDGNFYGTANYLGAQNLGTVFRISPSGSYSNLYSFGSLTNDGANPYGGLVRGTNGNFYGTTQGGGTNGFGTVFRISPSGSYSNLYSFASSTNDGANPYGGLVQGSDGNFYGTTEVGGTNACGCGTVFRISPSGNHTTLHSFAGPPTDGAYPFAGLARGTDGNFYGTTFGGGSPGPGTVFRISPSGTYSNLYSFGSQPNDGANPFAALVQGSDGNFYGTTENGGTPGPGTVFRLTVPLNPPPWPINQITSVRVAVTNIIFTVLSIAGETYQLQFSSSMSPTNWSNVPAVSVTNSIGSTLTFTNFGGAVAPKAFYRFDITP
jgi:uncharacterized repeat protein (TIGR03803 family)